MAGKKPGRFAHVIHSLPRTFASTSDDAPSQDKVDAVKRAIIEEFQEEHNGRLPSAADLAREWADMRAAKDLIEENLRTINAQIAAVTQLMVNQYETEGIEKLHLETGEAPRVQYEPYFSVEDPDKFRRWCIANGYERSLTLPWQTRVSIGKDALLSEEGPGTIPDGLKAWNRPKIVKR